MTASYFLVAETAVQTRTDPSCTTRYRFEVTTWATIRGWIGRRGRRDDRTVPPWGSPPPTERRASRVPGEYQSLHSYLEHRHAAVVVLTFDQIEALLGLPLPTLASTERDWWVDAAVPVNRHSEAWLDAGRTAAPNLSARTVTFERRP